MVPLVRCSVRQAEETLSLRVMVRESVGPDRSRPLSKHDARTQVCSVGIQRQAYLPIFG